MRAVRAAYRGAVEFEDQHIGMVYDAFQAYLERSGREGVFIYLSDHGEAEGYRGCYGKETFYECSAHVPMIVAGAGVQQGARKYGAVSLLDIAPTILELTGSIDLPHYDGVSLVDELQSDLDDQERIVYAETGGTAVYGPFSYGRMAKAGSTKYITYYGFEDADALYDCQSDPWELSNIITEQPEQAARLRHGLDSTLTVPIEDIKQRAELESQWMKILLKCNFDSEDLWHCPPEARQAPNPCVSSKVTLEDWLRRVQGGKDMLKQLKD